MAITRSIWTSLVLATGLLACGNSRSDREPPVPGTNANSPRVVQEEDPITHRPIATQDRPSASNPNNDYTDQPRVPGAPRMTGSPANSAPVAAGATAAASDPGNVGDRTTVPLATDAGVGDAGADAPTPR